jgi:7,8-dihydropterin-6-yl-methyl-4-(beta-D-ribofuranosyl)aminobenzene 5'-phosphate synthase
MIEVTATVLCENTVYGGGIGEHGWAVWVETPSGAFLFDTGQGKTLWHNAAYFRTDLSTARGICVSHHHYDHTGGLMDALRLMRRDAGAVEVPLYAHFDLFKESYAVPKGKKPRYIGIPFSRAALEGAGVGLDLAHGWREVGDRVYLTGEIPRRTTFELGDGNLKHFDAQGELVPDPICDDQAMVIETRQGLVVILGCSHAGVINILNYIIEKTGRTDFHTVIGGTHLGGAKENQVEKTVQGLLDYQIQRIGTTHCTGPAATAQVARAFGERFVHCSVGTVIEV